VVVAEFSDVRVPEENSSGFTAVPIVPPVADRVMTEPVVLISAVVVVSLPSRMLPEPDTVTTILPLA
jgi:hypothetical protein